MVPEEPAVTQEEAVLEVETELWPVLMGWDPSQPNGDYCVQVEWKDGEILSWKVLERESGAGETPAVPVNSSDRDAINVIAAMMAGYLDADTSGWTAEQVAAATVGAFEETGTRLAELNALVKAHASRNNSFWAEFTLKAKLLVYMHYGRVVMKIPALRGVPSSVMEEDGTRWSLASIGDKFFVTKRTDFGGREILKNDYRHIQEKTGKLANEQKGIERNLADTRSRASSLEDKQDDASKAVIREIVRKVARLEADLERLTRRKAPLVAEEARIKALLDAPSVREFEVSHDLVGFMGAEPPAHLATCLSSSAQSSPQEEGE